MLRLLRSILNSIKQLLRWPAKAIRIVVWPVLWVNAKLHVPSASAYLVLVGVLLLVGTQLTLVWANKAGLIVNIVTLFVLTAFALGHAKLRKFYISLAILPIAQVAASSFVTHTAFQTATIFYGLLLLLSLVYRYMFTLDEPVEATQLKWRGHFFGLPLMVVIGQLLGVIGYAFLRHHYAYTHISLPLVFAAAIVFAFAEEMFLRGLVQQQASKLVHPLAAAGLTSMLYVVLAFSNTTLLTLGPAVAMGVVLSLVYYFKRNLVLSIAVNASAKILYVGLVATFILR